MRFGDRVAAIRASLFDQRKRIAQAAIRRARHHGERARLDRQSFLGRDALQRLDDFGERKRAEMEMLRARADRLDQIFGLRSGHDEDHFFRRLFEGLEQRVGSFVGEHVRFIEDDHLVASADRRVPHHIAQLANLVDASIGGGIDFQHVQRTARGNLAARIALIARRRCGSVNAIQRFGQNSGRGRLSHAPRARKNISVRHAAALKRILQRTRDVLLSDKFRKSLGPPLSCNNLIAHGSGY